MVIAINSIPGRKAEMDFKPLRYASNSRVRSEKAAEEATRIADGIALGVGLTEKPDPQEVFAARHVCAYRAVRRAWRRPIPQSERNLWAQRCKVIRDYLVEENLGLVYTTLGRFRPNPADWDDFKSEALLALVRAVEGFDPWRGYRFSTYAWNAISRSLMHASKKASRHRLQFPLELDGERELPVQNDTWSELFVDRLRQALHENLAELTDRESEILARRFPEDGKLRLTLREIGDALGLSKERIRQIQKSALSKLREVLEADPALQ